MSVGRDGGLAWLAPVLVAAAWVADGDPVAAALVGVRSGWAVDEDAADEREQVAVGGDEVPHHVDLGDHVIGHCGILA